MENAFNRISVLKNWMWFIKLFAARLLTGWCHGKAAGCFSAFPDHPSESEWFWRIVIDLWSLSRIDDRSFSFPKIKDTQKIRSSLGLWSDPVSSDCWMFQQGTGGFFPQRWTWCVEVQGDSGLPWEFPDPWGNRFWALYPCQIKMHQTGTSRLMKEGLNTS